MRSDCVIAWTTEMDVTLGTQTDKAIAKRLGVSLSAVNVRRNLLGIPPYSKHETADSRDKRLSAMLTGILSVMTDKKAAEASGLPVSDVKWFRARHRVKLLERSKIWTDDLDRLLGTKSDTDIGNMIGISREAVRVRRVKRGVPKFIPYYPDPPIHLIGTEPDKYLEKRFNLMVGSVGKLRRSLGMASYKPEQEHAEINSLLGTASDYEIARQFRTTEGLVRVRRLKAGIQSFGSKVLCCCCGCSVDRSKRETNRKWCSECRQHQRRIYGALHTQRKNTIKAMNAIASAIENQNKKDSVNGDCSHE
jgi:hypothetical protein